MRRTILLLFVCLCLPVFRVQAVSTRHLSPTYRKWIEETVPYIITEEERHQFLELTTDEARDRFIERFWADRDPDPHSAVNIYKEEHYRRLAYVRENFGDSRYDDGWRTDMGRVYITLGAPQQISKFHAMTDTRPIEIWFYQSPSPALPIYFNLVFYKRSEADPYTLYSPRQDGPTRIVTNDLHDDAQALHTITQALGAEAAHAMVSLLPSEPVDMKHPDPSMQSEMLLAEVRNLADQKLEKDRILRQRSRKRESTSFSLLTGEHASSLQTVVLRDPEGQFSVHYLMRNVQPDASLIGTLPDKKLGYRLTLRTQVSTSTGKAVYVREEKLSGVVSETAAANAKDKIFAGEGRLPLAPGSYVLESTLVNERTHEATKSSANVTVPVLQQHQLGVSNVMAYTGSPVRDAEGRLPFAMEGIRFPPRGEQIVEIRAGEKLPLVYQVWFGRDELPVSAAAPKVLHASYVLGAVAQTAGKRVEESEDLPIKNLDSSGNLLTGRTLNTTSLDPGTYRLVLKLKIDDLQSQAFGTMTVRVLPSDAPCAMWTAYSTEADHPLWQDQLLRGLSAEATENRSEAKAFYKKALELNPAALEAKNRLEGINRK